LCSSSLMGGMRVCSNPASYNLLAASFSFSAPALRGSFITLSGVNGNILGPGSMHLICACCRFLAPVGDSFDLLGGGSRWWSHGSLSRCVGGLMVCSIALRNCIAASISGSAPALRSSLITNSGVFGNIVFPFTFHLICAFWRFLAPVGDSFDLLGGGFR